MKLRVDRLIKVGIIFILVLVIIIVGIRGCCKGVEKMLYPIKYSEFVDK